MRRLAAVAAALAVLAACSAPSGPSDGDPNLKVKSDLLRRMPSTARLLYVTASGEGGGEVLTTDVTLSWLTDDVFEKSDISGVYWAYVPAGTVVHLSATPSTGSSFIGWFGTCRGPGSCDVTLDANVDVGAQFEREGYGTYPTSAQLAVVATGHGVGTVTGGGLTCTSGLTTGCSALLDLTTPAQTVTLHAEPDADSLFQGWSGACSGVGDCTLTMDAPRTAYATFAPRVLTVNVRVFGTGTVTGPDGFTCSSATGCDLQVPNETPPRQVALTASPEATFVSWTGDCSVNTLGCTLTVDDDKNVFASWGEMLFHLATLGTGDVVVFEPSSSNIDHSGGISMTESCTTCHSAHLVTQHARQCDLCHAGSRPAQALIGVWNKTCSQGACHPSVHTRSPGDDHFRMWQNTSRACDRCHDGQGGFPGGGDNCARCHSPALTAAAVGDHQPPTTTSDAQGAYLGGATVHLSATDAGTAGVSVTWFSLDGHEWTLGSPAGQVTEVYASAPATGTRTHTLQFYSVDHALNAEAVQSVTFATQSVDATPPVTSSTFNPLAGAVYRTSQPVTLVASDGGSGVGATYYRIDAGGFVQGTSFSVAGDGLHTFSFYSVDRAGNTETTHVSSQFRIDGTPPSTSCSAASGTIYTGSQTFTLAATDAGSGVASTWYRLDSGSFTAGTSIAVAAPTSGSASHTIQWYSLDAAGNQEPTKSVTFTLSSGIADTTPPATTCSAVAGTTYTGSQTFTLAATDSGSGVAGTWYSLDAGAFTAGLSIAIAAPASGIVPHTIRWYSRDAAGNQEATKSVTFSVAAAGTPATVTLSFRTNASFGGWSYIWWEAHDANGNVVTDLSTGGACSFSNDDPAHPSSMWLDCVVPASTAYTMLGSWGPMPDGPDSDYATRDVTAVEATPGATLTWWWY